ncbi:hypothetical protein OM427_10410 [Halomonas sp. 18H]|nr:hypothetical protein [Halomonas sp. 18H]MCW4149936.1 hypothetical protein [Halomonas sp. 18H]
MAYFPLNLTLILLANYPEFPDSSFSLQLSLCEHVANMLVNRPQLFAEKLCHLCLTQPDSVLFKRHFQLCLAVFAGEYLYLLILHRLLPPLYCGQRIASTIP